ncbi:cysteine hydrolase family protein [Mycoplasma sp. P36-A1]|uniref:cysteine hydrolase family protein n=1 Tax=Mycoplasma sp. P36-A1 TaxID=3252900 RepID=UPI003C2B3826
MKLNSNNDLLVIIDMINGFTYEGAFASSNVCKIIPKMTEFVKEMIDNNIEVVHYTDQHISNATEFSTYPIHCIKGNNESLPIDALNFKEISIIPKNSTNGFFAKNPFDYKKNIYIIGCVSDICVFEFALSAQKYKEEKELTYTVNVISDLVATFDAPNHDAKIVHEEYMNNLKNRGVNIISL